MFGFMNSNLARFADWAFPLVMRGDVLVRIVEADIQIPKSVKDAFKTWAVSSRTCYEEIRHQVQTEYGLPELEALRVESCANIIQGHWQSAVCLTNILLEAFLKLALIYSNTDDPDEKAQPLSRLVGSLSAPVEKYMQMDLNGTINAARKVGLIDKRTKKDLHTFRERFRNAFFHADMQAMFGDETTPVTGLDFGTQDIEHSDVAIRALPLLLGEALWQTAEANAITYFKIVDALIRETLPKVFPHLNAEQPEAPGVEGE
ncbi:MAG: hypothetical protein HUU46_07700 [Candidatus Hydrogenedentes bacterium]|nr:hypothetical protein [Candidatus Hydrogenedentota bacterium]